MPEVCSVSDLTSHDHACLVYGRDAERCDVSARSLAACVSTGHRVGDRALWIARQLCEPLEVRGARVRLELAAR